MALRPTHPSGASRKKTRKPVLEPLERRELCTVTDFKATAVPQVLVPQNNRWVPILVQGTFHTTAKESPSANFQVIDEYREYQTQRPVRVQQADNTGRSFKFAFVIHLRASVSASTSTSRQYYIVLAAKDNDGANGTAVPVIVPPVHVSRPHPVAPRARAFHHVR